MQNDPDWNLVVQAQIAIEWIFKSQSSKDIYLRTAVAKYREENENCELVNPGLLMAYAYIVFVYPRETIIKEIDEGKLDFSDFDVLVGHISVRRIRNAIAHGRFSFSKKAILTLTDNNRKRNNPFKASISAGKFGIFLQSFVNLAKYTYFQKK
tara:strand:- start:112 stop:570 length:459 start_codon:yes stop_codon:yes gene_type:complete